MSGQDTHENGGPEERVLARIRRWSRLMDESFQVPGTKIRFGWDPILGLLPGLGDLLGALLPLFILMQAQRLGVPHIIKARMILNVLIDVLVGAIPLIGDLFDFAWKSNMLNLALLEKYAGVGAKPGIGDWAFVLGTVATALIVLALPIIVLVLLFRKAESLLSWPSLWSI